MKTMIELKAQLEKTTSLAEKIAIRIQMIELNRKSENPDSDINSPMSSFLSNLQGKETFALARF
jgi:hypothetical protein